MSFGDRLGMLGAFLALVALAITILWPDKRWIGWIALGCAVLLLVGWGWIEIGSKLPRLRSQYPKLSTVIVFIVGGCLAAALWKLVTPPAKPKPEHSLSEAAQTSATKLVGRIDFILPDVMPSIYPTRGTAILLGVSIINTGPPSVAGVWRLQVKMVDAEPIVLEPEVIPGPITLAPSGGKRYVVNPSNALYDKTAHSPIPSGGREAGVLWFLAPNVETAEMRRPGTKYSLTFEDSYSQKGVTEYAIPAASNPAYKYMPGEMSELRGRQHHPAGTRTSQVISAPNGIAIGGGTVISPTVNNYQNPPNIGAAEQENWIQRLAAFTPTYVWIVANPDDANVRNIGDEIHAVFKRMKWPSLVLPYRYTVEWSLTTKLPRKGVVVIASKENKKVAAIRQLLAKSRISTAFDHNQEMKQTNGNPFLLDGEHFDGIIIAVGSDN